MKAWFDDDPAPWTTDSPVIAADVPDLGALAVRRRGDDRGEPGLHEVDVRDRDVGQDEVVLDREPNRLEVRLETREILRRQRREQPVVEVGLTLTRHRSFLSARAPPPIACARETSRQRKFYAPLFGHRP
jgi:hypothetical protein